MFMKSGRKTGMRVLAMLLALALGTASLWTGTSAHASAPEAYVPEAAAVHEMEVEVPADSQPEQEKVSDLQEESDTEEKEEEKEKEEEQEDEEGDEETEEEPEGEPERSVAAAGVGTGIIFAFDQEAYLPGEPVTAFLTPEAGYVLELESIQVKDA